jgi:hypothetical protein
MHSVRTRMLVASGCSKWPVFSSHNRYLYTAILLLISIVCSVKSCMLLSTNTSYSRAFALGIGAIYCRHPVLESHLGSCAT